MFATIQYKNGKTARQEFYYGESFLSQSGRFFNIDQNMSAVSITDNFGRSRNILLNWPLAIEPFFLTQKKSAI